MTIRPMPSSRAHPNPPRRSRRVRALALAMLSGALGLASCSNNSSPTSPYGGGGGGGGGGTLFNFGPFALSQSAQFTFSGTGSFGYHCIPHQAMGMVGTVQVDAAGADSQVVQIGAGGLLAFTPGTAHVKPGAYVRWVNASGLTIHTVTSNN